MLAGTRDRAKRGRWRRNAIWLGGVALAALLAWLAGFLWFAAGLPGEPPHGTGRTDAIVVLTGGSGRVDQGLRLLAQKRARKLFVSGVYRGVDVERLLELASDAPAALSCCVTLGYEAHSTRGNAIETARWVAENDIRSLRLVTAAYHMPRSLLEFRRRMPGVEIVPHPVFPPHVKQDEWWRWPGSAHLLAIEYTKYLLAWLRGLVLDAGEAVTS